MKICRVTAVTSGYDDIEVDDYLDDGADRFLFSDDPGHFSKPGWMWRPLPLVSLNSKRRTMFVKSNLPKLCPGYDIYVWSDARITFTQPMPELVNRYLPPHMDLMTFKHPRNNCLKDEMKEIAKEGVVGIKDLIGYYKELSQLERQWPIISETNVYFARGNERYQEMCQKWNWRIEYAPPRDQLSFDLACADVGLVYDWFDDGETSAVTAEFVKKRLHNRPKGASRKVDDSLMDVARDTRPVTHLSRDGLSSDTDSGERDLSVVIPVHNAAEELGELLTSIRQSEFAGEVVLVENGSTDNALEVCQRFETERSEFPTRVVVSDEPLGFSGACNSGAQAAEGKYLVFLNSDTRVHGKWWKPLEKAFHLSSVAVVGAIGNKAGDCSVGNAKTSQLIELGAPITLISKACSEYVSNWAIDVPFQLTRSASGHAFAILKDAFEEAGGFDHEAFPVGYGEEVDLFLRLTRAGWLVGVEPSWYVFHAGQATFGEERREKLARQGRRMLARRYGEEKIARLSNDLRNNPFIQTLNYDLNHYLEIVISSLEITDEQTEDDKSHR